MAHDANQDETISKAQKELKRSQILLFVFQVVLVILFAAVADWSEPMIKGPGTVTEGYNMFIGVEIMMFVGFGYLMTFLKLYGLGAVGFTMMITAIGLQWYLFVESFFEQLASGEGWHPVQVTVYSLMGCLFGISAVLISFGALIGKLTPFQLLIMTLVELVLHAIDRRILMSHFMELSDLGGTYVDHMFGAYFGLAVAYQLGPPKGEPIIGSIPDIFSLIGTVFLWIYWPSFVAGEAEIGSDQQHRAIINTILALSASTITSFWASSLFGRAQFYRFRPVDIQNATLAGGVAIGSTANLMVSGFGAIMVGISAGVVSAIGYNYVLPFLEKKGLHDTCGIHNLHGMPSLIGAIASVIVAALHEDREIYGENHHRQWMLNLLSIPVCIIFAWMTGLVTGAALKKLQPSSDLKEFHDKCWWLVAEDYDLLDNIPHLNKPSSSFANTAPLDSEELNKGNIAVDFV